MTIPLSVKAVSFDLDSTLADTQHRQWMINRNGHTDWETYSLACADDGPGPALPLAQYLTVIDVPIVICSARSNESRALTYKWLHDHDVNPWFVQLNDGTHNGLSHGGWKAQKLLLLQEAIGRPIAFHVDDWADVAIETEKVGIKTMLVHHIGSQIVDEVLA